MYIKYIVDNIFSSWQFQSPYWSCIVCLVLCFCACRLTRCPKCDWQSGLTNEERWDSPFGWTQTSSTLSLLRGFRRTGEIQTQVHFSKSTYCTFRNELQKYRKRWQHFEAVFCHYCQCWPLSVLEALSHYLLVFTIINSLKCFIFSCLNPKID